MTTLRSLYAAFDAAWIGWILFVLIPATLVFYWLRRPRAEHLSTLDEPMDDVRELKKRWTSMRNLLTRLPAWITPNRITWARLPLLAVALVCLCAGWYLCAFWITVLHEVFDFLDGAVAHAQGKGSAFGEFLDPLVDKIATASTFLCLAGLFVRQGGLALAAAYWPLIALSCWFAVQLTVLRSRRGSTTNAKPGTFAAKGAGKLKAVCEDIAQPALILALGVEHPMIFFLDGWILLAVSVALAHLSLKSQRASAPKL